MSWTWDVDPILAPGPVPLRYYGLFAAFALVGGFLLFRWQMLRAGRDETATTMVLPYTLVATIVGARLGHCLVYDLPICFDPPYRVLMIWQGGLASHGALIGLVLALALYARLNRLVLVDVLDRAAFGAALAVVCVRVGNFFNSEIVGRVTETPWGVRFPRFDRGLIAANVPLRHPVQLYEATLGLAILAALWLLDRRLGDERPRGLYASIFLLAYFGGRLGLERYKAFLVLDPTRATFTMGQLLSLLPALIGAAGLMLLSWRWLRARRRAQ
jgi:phosphatidylglycerol:prolipoprotein diacylglycerol transferase